MKRTILGLSLAFLGVSTAFGQSTSSPSFPTGFAAVYAPKTGKTAAVVKVDDPRGILPGLHVPFTKITFDAIPFVYLGVQIGNGNPGAAGAGLCADVSGGKSLKFQLGGTYGGVAGDNSPHFGLFGSATWVFVKVQPTASIVHILYADTSTVKFLANIK